MANDMRGVLGLLGLLVVVAALGLLAKRQLVGGSLPIAKVSDSVVGTPAPKSSQIQQEVKQAAEAGMKARVVDDK